MQLPLTDALAQVEHLGAVGDLWEGVVPRQAALAVYDTEAGWEYEGAWALLRFIRDHQAYERLPT